MPVIEWGKESRSREVNQGQTQPWDGWQEHQEKWDRSGYQLIGGLDPQCPWEAQARLHHNRCCSWCVYGERHKWEGLILRSAHTVWSFGLGWGAAWEPLCMTGEEEQPAAALSDDPEPRWKCLKVERCSYRPFIRMAVLKSDVFTYFLVRVLKPYLESWLFQATGNRILENNLWIMNIHGSSRFIFFCSTSSKLIDSILLLHQHLK